MVERTPPPETEPRKQMKVKLPLVLYDVLIFVLTDLLLLVLYRGGKSLSFSGVLQQSLVAFVCIFGSRYAAQIYRQIWRYGGIQCYIRLLLADCVLAPVFIILIVLGAIFMRGNPFFTQERPGKNERIFRLIKFRTMDNRKDKDGRLLPDEVRLNKYGRVRC